MNIPTSLTRSPPNSAKHMSTNRAKIVPPGAAMGPSTVRATKNTAITVTAIVRKVATSPDGGKNFVVTLFDWSLLETCL